MRKLVMLLLGVLLLCGQLLAQTRAISGKVFDANGAPVPFATISVRGTNTATSADASGSFTINASTGAVLVVSAVGFQEQTATVGASDNITITLQQKAELTEVVVTALGIQRQKRDLGYATATVSNEALNAGRAVNIANGLQGKVSGLNVTSFNSGVFEDVKINLRGIRSITGTANPMLLLDGVQADLNLLASINPNDVENISVLKGTSGAAIYGPDARNGVIVVTTKKGVRGNAKPVVTLSSSVQLSRVSFFPKLQTQFGNGGYGEFIPYENWSWGPAYDGTERELGRPLEDGSQQMVTYSARPDERKKFFNTGVIWQNDISYAAKDFYISLQDADIKGIVPQDKNRRTGIRLNTAREYGKFKVSVNTNYVEQNYNVYDDEQQDEYFRLQNVGNNEGLMNLIFNTPAHVPLTSYKDFKNNPYADYNGYFNDYGLNPYFAIDNWRRSGKNQTTIINLDLSLRPTDWLTLTWRPGIQNRAITDRFISKGVKPSEYAMAERSFTPINAAVEERAYTQSRLSSELFGSMEKDLNDDFRLSGVVGTYVRQVTSRNTRVGAGNLVVDNVYNISNRTGELTGTSPYSRTRLFSVYASAGLNYKNWANIELTGRNDVTSVLAAGNRSYFYPGVNAAVVLTDAIDGLSSNTLSYFKLRGAWNRSANADVDPYLLTPTYTQPDGFPYGSLPGFTASNTTTNPLLKPEFINNLEVGFEASLFNNRLGLDMAYYHQDNTDQIVSVRTSDATGYNFVRVNAADFVNKGVEMDVRITPIAKFGKDGRVEFRANALYSDTKINSLYQSLDEIVIGGYTVANNSAVVNAPAFVLRANDYVRDPQGRVVVDSVTGYPSVDPTLKSFGRTMPKWIIGLSPSVAWNNFSFSALFEFKGGHVVYNGMGAGMAWTGVGAATAVNNREPFVYPNSSILGKDGQYRENTSVAVSDVNDFFTSVYQDVSSNFISSANAWRWRELSIAYEFPAKALGKQDIIKGVSVSLTGRNLFLWVPKSQMYQDPDYNEFTDTNSMGLGTGQVNPPARHFGANVTLRF